MEKRKTRHESDAEKERNRDVNTIKLFILRLSVFLLTIYMLFGVVFSVRRVPDLSMKPKLMAGDLTLAYRLERDYVAGDVVYYVAGGKTRIGRVVARPGETVSVKDGSLYVNGSIVMDQDVYYKTEPFGEKVTYPCALGNDRYFILGDMREGARDSRFFGPVSGKDIQGKVIVAIRRSHI